MKILIINTYDIGGAANSCKRLHFGLISHGISSTILLRLKQNNWSKTQCYKQTNSTLTWFNKLVNKSKRILKELKLYNTIPVSKKKEQMFIEQRLKGLEMFSFPNSDFDVTKSEIYIESDIVNLHWVANFLDYKSFFEKNLKPVVWTLHDMNPFSGGEHYTETISGIDEYGLPILRNVSEEEIRVASENIKIKKQAISKIDNIIIVAPSEWLAAAARESEVFKNKEIHCIPYGLDTEIFAPRDKNYSRKLLNIPMDKKVILFVADSIENNRKGFIFLKKAMEQLSDSNLILCAIGNKNADLESVKNFFEMGPVFDERMMSIIYSAADIFVIPSLMDNLPNTALESLLCGTPVIGFPVGGIIEIIQDNENGYLTKDISVGSLVETLQKFLENPNFFDKATIRENAIKKYDQSVQSQKYINLFNSLLNK